MATIGDLKKHLEGYKDTTHCAYGLWLPSDVRTLTRKLDADGVNNVLDAVHDNHDANNGINWDTLRWAIGDELPTDDKPDTDTGVHKFMR